MSSDPFRIRDHVAEFDAIVAEIVRRSEETRVWERRDGVWKHVHFHRSANE